MNPLNKQELKKKLQWNISRPRIGDLGTENFWEKMYVCVHTFFFAFNVSLHFQVFAIKTKTSTDPKKKIDRDVIKNIFMALTEIHTHMYAWSYFCHIYIFVISIINYIILLKCPVYNYNKATHFHSAISEVSYRKSTESKQHRGIQTKIK